MIFACFRLRRGSRGRDDADTSPRRLIIVNLPGVWQNLCSFVGRIGFGPADVVCSLYPYHFRDTHHFYGIGEQKIASRFAGICIMTLLRARRSKNTIIIVTREEACPSTGGSYARAESFRGDEGSLHSLTNIDRK